MANTDPSKSTGTLPRLTSSQSVTSSPAALLQRRRQSSNERIDEILQNARQRADDLAQAAVVAAADNSYPRAPGGGGSESNRGLGLRRTLTSLSFYEDSANAERQQQHRPAPDETTAVLSPRYGGSLRNYRTTSDTPTYSMTGRTPRGGSPVATRTRSIYGDRGPTDLDEADEDEHGGSSARDEKKESWWTKAVSPLQSIELENHGSVARDHLALERTFLAWLRTSLAFASIGIAVTQLFRLNTSVSDPAMSDTLRRFGRPLGATFLGISIVILLLGYRRFHTSQKWIIQGKFPASRGTVITLVLITLAIMLVSLIVVVVIHPRA